MIIIDTNVISEPWKPAPDANALAWIDTQNIETLYISAVTIAELRFGIAAMPAGQKRSTLDGRLEREVIPLFSGRILPFDLEASRAYAELISHAKAAGRAIGKADEYIAATAIARRFAVATRDASPFEAAGITVIDPWKI